MKLYLMPPSPRAFKVIALKNHLGIECETQFVDLISSRPSTLR
jgi:glutathione S-transferase